MDKDVVDNMFDRFTARTVRVRQTAADTGSDCPSHRRLSARTGERSLPPSMPAG